MLFLSRSDNVLSSRNTSASSKRRTGGYFMLMTFSSRRGKLHTTIPSLAEVEDLLKVLLDCCGVRAYVPTTDTVQRHFGNFPNAETAVVSFPYCLRR